MHQQTSPLDASWKCVDQFSTPNAEDAHDWELVEESEELVTMDLADAERVAGVDTGLVPGTEVSVTGLNTETPMLKIDGTVLMGSWDELLGSEIVLHEHAHARAEYDTHIGPGELAHSDQVLELRPLSPTTGTHVATGASTTTQRHIAFVPVRASAHAAAGTNEQA
ncbi:hypothetical protein MSPP1_001434 [Malassezia sp. CBS 17886]|nr:hypothetical protein MSPP1_001434 [Malassezia sp. CBS 17886]